jgi:hypothetical protein
VSHCSVNDRTLTDSHDYCDKIIDDDEYESSGDESEIGGFEPGGENMHHGN